MQHGRGHAAWTQSRSMDLVMQHGPSHAARTQSCSMDRQQYGHGMQNGHGHTVWTWTYSTSMSLLYARVPAAYPRLCCMDTGMQPGGTCSLDVNTWQEHGHGHGMDKTWSQTIIGPAWTADNFIIRRYCRKVSGSQRKCLQKLAEVSGAPKISKSACRVSRNQCNVLAEVSG